MDPQGEFFSGTIKNNFNSFALFTKKYFFSKEFQKNILFGIF
jgi:hypothetical protein